MTNTIDASYMLSTYKEAKSKTGSNVLGKDDFLKLLIAQLQNQDPTNPMNDTEFVAQMTSFSVLEQLTNMNSSMNQLVEQSKQSQWLSYSQFIGREVTWHKVTEAEDGTLEITEGSGIVTGIHFKEDHVIIMLDDGTELEPANISQVKLNQVANESTLSQASTMIGKLVTYSNGVEEDSALVQSVSMKDGQLSLYLDDGLNTVLSPAQIRKVSQAGGS